MTNALRFFRATEGVSAVEFALGAPVAAIVLLGIASGWTSAVQVSDMNDSVRAAASYVLKGGLDPEAAKSVATSSWRNKPEDGVVQVTKQCTCAGIGASCTEVCTADNSIPQMSYVIETQRTLKLPLIGLLETNVPVTRQEVVRVR